MALTNPNPTDVGTPVSLGAAVGGLLGRGRYRTERPVWMEKPHPLAQIAKAVFLLVVAVTMLFPIVYVIAVSFSSHEDVLGGGLILWPANPTLDAYRAIFRGSIVLRALQVTVGLTLIGTLVQVFFTTLMAWGLSKPGVPGSKFVLFLVLGSMLFGAGIIPNFLLVKELGLLNTYASLIMPGLIGGFNLIILRNFFMNLPGELMDSARTDGANDWQLLWDIVLPLSKAALAVIALFTGVGIWNTFFNAVLYLNDTSMWPIQVVLRQYVLEGSFLDTVSDPNRPPPPPQTISMAVIVAATLPILLVYPFLQKYFTKGVLTGAIKG